MLNNGIRIIGLSSIDEDLSPNQSQNQTSKKSPQSGTFKIPLIPSHRSQQMGLNKSCTLDNIENQRSTFLSKLKIRKEIQ